MFKHNLVNVMAHHLVFGLCSFILFNAIFDVLDLKYFLLHSFWRQYFFLMFSTWLSSNNSLSQNILDFYSNLCLFMCLPVCLSVLLASFIYINKNCLIWKVLGQTTRVSAPRRSLVLCGCLCYIPRGFAFSKRDIWPSLTNPLGLSWSNFAVSPLHSDLRELII